MGDFNARIENSPISKNIGSNVKSTKNKNGQRLIDLAIYNNLYICNTLFQHTAAPKFTWTAREHTFIIDYVITNEKLKHSVLDTRVYRSLETESDHHLLVCTLRFLPR
jgi:endonuclease/exonuclease/phosphatase family metal-dependent hydrolase